MSDGGKGGLGETDHLPGGELLRRRLSHVVVSTQQRIKVGVGQAGCVGGLLLFLDGQGDRGMLQRRLRSNHCSLT